MVKCCVPGCLPVEEGEIRNLFRFPFSLKVSKFDAVKKKRRQSWFHQLKMDYEDNKDFRVCNLHFVSGNHKVFQHIFFYFILS